MRATIRRLDRDVARSTAELAATRGDITHTRRLVDKLAPQVPPKVTAERLREVGHSGVAQPLLSIAIPSFNRPEELTECLASVVAEVATCPAGLVEVCITDDASADPDALDVAVSFAERHPCIAVRRNASNVGLEENLLIACEPCRGDYVLILGNDDRLRSGALEIMIEDLQSRRASVYLYDKQRITRDGVPRDDIPGSIPIDLPSGEAHVFASMIEAAARHGFLSTFGFVSSVLFARHPFAETDPSPYLGLTMYAQVFVMIEAFAGRPVQFRNFRTVDHRTPTPRERTSDVLGRREEPFWTPGERRRSRYFGTTLAAAFQRVADRSGLPVHDIVSRPDSLWGAGPLGEWLQANRALDPGIDAQLDLDVVRDADRLIKAARAAVTPAHSADAAAHPEMSR